MTHPFRTAAAAVLIAGALGAAGCSPESAPVQADAALAQDMVQSQDVRRFTIGDIEAFALRDGALSHPNDNSALGADQTREAVAAVLTAAGAPADTIELSIQPLLLRTGDRVVLIDTGAGGQMGVESTLLASLATAGVAPGEVTDILISHAHGDHVGGLVTAEGELAFPNATIRMSEAEWAAAQAYAPAAELVAAITPKVETFQPGAVVAPGIQAVDLTGHTPGHTGYEIASAGETLLYIGDAMHSSILSVQKPGWRNAWDDDNERAIGTREALLARGVAEDLRVYGVHFPFPGLGRFESGDEGYVWVPET